MTWARVWMWRSSVPVVVDDLVALAEADEVGRDAAVAGGDERRDHAAVEVAPGGLAVEQEHDGRGRAGVGAGGALIEVVDAQALPLQVVGSEQKVRQPIELRVRCAYRVGHSSPPFVMPARA